MTYADFQTTTYGKWILSGEHAVLRGHGALVFPIFSKKLTLRYHSPTHSLHIDVDGEQGSGLQALFERVLAQGASLVGRHFADITGVFAVENSIPIGVGMGASAALCVAVARWFIYKNWVAEKQLFEFAKELEHLFHGKSSGLDIVGASAETGLFFKKGEIQAVTQTWQPNWLLSYCGTKSKTSDCIAKVQRMWEKTPADAALVDEKMNESVEQARRALALKGDEAQSLLIESINQAAGCFREWGLISDPLDTHMQQLLQEGACAVKPTGSGGGGYVLSLWYSIPPLIKDNDQEAAWIAL